jgi:hypothetical protein
MQSSRAPQSGHRTATQLPYRTGFHGENHVFMRYISSPPYEGLGNPSRPCEAGQVVRGFQAHLFVGHASRCDTVFARLASPRRRICERVRSLQEQLPALLGPRSGGHHHRASGANPVKARSPLLLSEFVAREVKPSTNRWHCHYSRVEVRVLVPWLPS